MKRTLFMKQLAAYFDVFLPQNKNCSQNTITAYAYGFASFFEFMSQKMGVEHYKIDYDILTPKLFDDYVLWMQNEKSHSAATQRQRMAALTSFFKYASRREMSAIAALNAAAGSSTPKIKEPAFPYFTADEIKVLLRMPRHDGKSGYRDMAILSLMYDTAARAQEICDINVEDVTLGKTPKVILHGKGNKSREIPLSSDVAKMLRLYLKETPRNSSGPLFSSQRSQKMTTACIRNLVKKYVTLASAESPSLFRAKNYSPHSFRHSKAVHMLEAGVPLIYIRNFLGHESVKTTEVYAKVSQAGLEKVLTDHSIRSNIPAVNNEIPSKKDVPDFLKDLL